MRIKFRWQSFKYAWEGVGNLFQTQPNARVHLAVALLVITGGFFFQVSRGEWCALILSIGLVVAAEAFNTALEYLTDLASPDFHPLAGKAKDVAAGGVLILTLCAVAVGLIVFLPKILAW